jgi:hypothetical protein
MPASTPVVRPWSSAVLSVKSFGAVWRRICRRGEPRIATDSVPRHRYVVPSIATATLGLAVSFAAFEAVSLREQHLAEVEFRARASNYVLLISS